MSRQEVTVGLIYAAFPSSVRRGGRDIKKYRAATSDGADGVCVEQGCFASFSSSRSHPSSVRRGISPDSHTVR